MNAIKAYKKPILQRC